MGVLVLRHTDETPQGSAVGWLDARRPLEEEDGDLFLVPGVQGPDQQSSPKLVQLIGELASQGGSPGPLEETPFPCPQ
ncbi:MAG: hypothetical protein M3537_03735, partial [Chloroflexota bacterium]|nr:hypothetical protein [Chloroflexota bacterium]